MNDILDWIRVAKLYDDIADVLGMLVLGATYAQYNILEMFRKLLLWLETCLKVSSSIKVILTQVCLYLSPIKIMLENFQPHYIHA
jgi:hypothetical protein